ncbi:ATP-utilizing chromatin assembly and remodelling N-terminal-domain-containing protein [Phellopilus nigrolimitatus]|nr:ATP-utilizing chromatin assembly and remodelling N-terminal-domain-containing protein [Phellopilus nigrolimitatus]
MPSCRRKHVLLTEPSPELLDAAEHDANKEVYLLAQTGEIFDTYEAYAARMSFYKLKQFQCEVTGKSGLDYFQALDSEQQEARTLHSRFPEPLKAAVLRSVQWQVMGRLDHLVEAVHDRFKDRYFEGEKVFIDVQGDKFAARVMQIYPPKPPPASSPSLKRKRSNSNSSDSSLLSLSSAPDSEIVIVTPIHVVGGDMNLSLEESLARDDPTKYFYKVQILEEERPQNEQQPLAPSVGRRESGRMKERGKEGLNGQIDVESRAKWAGSLMEVQCNAMSRDRLVFSKSLLRRFLRECVDRDSSLASPWTVKPAIAQRFGVPTDMPEEIRAGVEKVRKGEIDKRKKVWEEKEAQAEREGRLTKKMIKEKEREAKAAAKAVELAARQREAEEKAAATARSRAEKQAAEQAARAEAERLAAEKAKQKKKAVRYPTEDLDVRLNDRDKRAGMKLLRPVPSRSPEKLPFNETEGVFESFLAAWNFLICFGQPLHLSFLTLDDFEHALRHTHSDTPCSLLSEVHSVLIYNLRTVPFTRHAAVLSLLELQKNEMDVDSGDEPSIDMLTEALADVGNNWERVPLKHADGRLGWQDAVVGCLKDHATVSSFPRLRPILSKLLFEWSEVSSTPVEPISPGSSPLSSPTPWSAPVISYPSDRYYTLPLKDRIAILQFMCNLAVSSKAVHAHLEHCEEQLTALRKEKIEVNRQKKQFLEEMTALVGENKGDESQETPAPNETSDVDSEGVAPSEDASEAGSSSGRRGNSSQRQLTLRLKAQQGQAAARQRELARQKLASQKQALAEHRRLDEEVNKLERRLESIERDFRKTLGVIRLKPIGKDRFYNRIWWFDGCGTSSLMGSGGAVQYGAGRIFIQGPSEFDQEILDRKKGDEVDIVTRRREEEGDDGMLGMGEWAVFTEVEELEEFIAWLNPKGVREFALKNALTKWWDLLAPGIRKRTADIALNAKLPEARRSQRGKNANSDISREPYMLWTNRKAVN